jgi:hypothetical protein
MYEECDVLQFFIRCSAFEDGSIALSRNAGHCHPVTRRSIPDEWRAHTKITRDMVVRHKSQYT